MIRGVYTSAIGMITQMNKMDTITNNITNVDTTAYKQDNAIIQSFSEELMKVYNNQAQSITRTNNEIGQVTLGNFISEVYTDFSNGGLKETGGSFDFAISGEGFFTIQCTDASGNFIERFTRDGAFTLNSKGELVTKDGYYVLGENGVITIPNGEVSVSENGYIYVDGEFVDRLALTNFENLESLRKYGDNLYDTIDGSVKSEFTGSVIQSYLEESNVNVVNEMVRLISVSRVYEANYKMIQSRDETLAKAVNLGSK